MLLMFTVLQILSYQSLYDQPARMAPTPPGFRLEGGSVCVMFVSGHQEIFGWHNPEYVIGWTALMKIILRNFRQSSVMEEIKARTQKELEIWAQEGWMGRGKKVLLDLNISDEDYFPGKFGEIKQVKIQFQDELSTLLRFYVRQQRKPPARGAPTLKDLSLQNLSMIVEEAHQIGKLELPRQLQNQLDDQIRNCWKSRYLSDVREKNKSTNTTSALAYKVDKSHSWKAKYFDEYED